MRCYVHREVEAIGVCSECGQGICDACAVRIGGKLYCKDDADRVFAPRKEEIPEIIKVGRAMRVTVASVFFFMYSGVGIGIGILFIAAGYASGVFAGVPGFSSIAVTSIGLLGFGGLLVVMGILGVVCGLWLWKSQLTGVIVGIPLLLGGVAIASILVALYPTLIFYEVGGTVYFVNGTLFILLAGSWSKMERS